MQNIKGLVFLILSFCIAAISLQAQQDKNKVMVAFYNVENLFDTIHDPNKFDEEFTPEGDRTWGAERYQNKLDNLAKVISSMNGGNGPDILGLCEVENLNVLKDLVNTEVLKNMGYGIVHVESKDQRGIDNALLYKKSVLHKVNFTTLSVALPDSVPPTRDIMLVQSEIEGHSIAFVVCHFPSRSEGQEKSEYKRIAAAKVVRHLVDSLLAVDAKDNILIMGDFNDEPTDSSMLKVMGAANPEVKQLAALFNLMYPLKNKGLGSYKYRDDWNMLDQVIVSGGLISELNGLRYVKESAGIFAEEWMKQTEPKYLGSPLRTFGGHKYLAGYSDHFPVYITIEVK